MFCLLDSFADQSAKDRLDNLIKQKIIKEKGIMFYSDVIETDFADVEDLFSTDDYLKLYNGAFNKKLSTKDIDCKQPILKQIKKKNGGKDFNHYLPANYFAQNMTDIKLSNDSIDTFEELFIKINKGFNH